MEEGWGRGGWRSVGGVGRWKKGCDFIIKRSLRAMHLPTHEIAAVKRDLTHTHFSNSNRHPGDRGLVCPSWSYNGLNLNYVSISIACVNFYALHRSQQSHNLNMCTHIPAYIKAILKGWCSTLTSERRFTSFAASSAEMVSEA